jgi:hypothetical protein
MTQKITKTVLVRFRGNSGMSSDSYAYLTDIEGLAADDYVVVESPSAGMTLVRVASVEETPKSVEKATKWIVDRVDTKTYYERAQREADRALILLKLKKEQARVLEENQYAELAKVSTTAAELVAQLKALGE